MAVKTFDFAPPKGEQWEWSRIEMEHRQAIAVSLERIASDLSLARRHEEAWYDKFGVADAALLLMSERDEVISWFGDRDHVRLSEFTDRGKSVFGWSALHGKPVEAIDRTNYLRAERRGRGYRVYLLMEEGDRLYDLYDRLRRALANRECESCGEPPEHVDPCGATFCRECVEASDHDDSEEVMPA